jgi:hypothetical protein
VPAAQVAAVAAAAVAIAAGSSFALGRALGPGATSTPIRGSTTGSDLLGLRSDSTQQHMLAMLGRVHISTPNYGRLIAL